MIAGGLLFVTLLGKDEYRWLAAFYFFVLFMLELVKFPYATGGVG
jgi:hypothetical protein